MTIYSLVVISILIAQQIPSLVITTIVSSIGFQLMRLSTHIQMCQDHGIVQLPHILFICAPRTALLTLTTVPESLYTISTTL